MGGTSDVEVLCERGGANDGAGASEEGGALGRASDDSTLTVDCKGYSH